ncbi:hypothetical protein [Lysinibacillus sp. G4S2]|uniref:hypothetical protein n=1 Tax=Lysinibacillus sp. G4S2 TaxID=3055859 RepID=UPI0025A24723|nr:hypothetical protein [Lysinibacillus sp. G4S2]MDM5247566.1 hypothetical protein [Lysinibacillus sp. G4S2]
MASHVIVQLGANDGLSGGRKNFTGVNDGFSGGRKDFTGATASLSGGKKDLTGANKVLPAQTTFQSAKKVIKRGEISK